MINPKTNIDYAGKLLSSLFKQYGTWNKAISYYHSANPEYQGRYSKKVVLVWIGNKKI
jgi:soluble lytic murein transglycosylase-like protein